MCVFPVVIPCSENVKALSEAKRRVLAAVKGRMNPLKESLAVVRVRVLTRYYRALTCTCCGRRTVALYCMLAVVRRRAVSLHHARFVSCRVVRTA